MIEIHFPKRRRKRTKEKKDKKWKKKSLELGQREGCAGGEAWQCACCGKKDTRHKFGGSFAAPVVTRGACYGDDVSLNFDRLRVLCCFVLLSPAAHEP